MGISEVALILKLSSLSLVTYVGIRIIKRTIRVNKILNTTNNIIALSCTGQQCDILRKK